MKMKMRAKISGIVVLAILCFCAAPAVSKTTDEKADKKATCVKTAEECKGKAVCCNKTISEIFTVNDFESLFSRRNSPMGHAQGFYDYSSFVNAAKNFKFEKNGFASVGGELVQKRELAAFLAHIATDTSCASLMAAAEPAGSEVPYKWGLCYNQELSPEKTYCEPSLVYPCVPGASYHGRGASPVYWNYNYGQLGEALKVKLLHHPEYLADNATLAFATAMWKWMNPVKVKQPSAHQVMVGKWVPTKNDTDSLRRPGFGMTINILKGEAECGSGSDNKKMNDRIAHYNYFVDKMVGREHAGDNLDCSDQKVLNPSSSSSA